MVFRDFLCPFRRTLCAEAKTHGSACFESLTLGARGIGNPQGNGSLKTSQTCYQGVLKCLLLTRQPRGSGEESEMGFCLLP